MIATGQEQVVGEGRWPWRLVVAEDYEGMSREGAVVMGRALAGRPDLLLCTATGSSPTRAYELFVAECLRAEGVAARLRVLKLDEWGGLPEGNPSTCGAYLRRTLAGPLGFGTERFEGFCCEPRDPEAECRRVSGWLREHGPIDLCVLGLGLNGHLGFNEPGAALRPYAHVAELSETSLAHGMLAEGGVRPRYGMTIGMAEILGAREILVLVSGASKREAWRRLLEPRVDAGFPGSFLWLHPRVTLVGDRAAAGAGERVT